MGLVSGLSFGFVLILSALIIGAAFAVRYGLLAYQNMQRQQYRWYQSDKEFTIKELVVVSVVSILVFLPLTNVAVHAIAQSNAVGGFKEFWNGSIISAQSESITCNVNGRCRHTYDCNSRMVPTYSTDSKGNTTVTWHEEHDECPYVDTEYNYWLTDSIGEKYVIASNIFAANPGIYRGAYSEYRQPPSNVARGIPEEWVRVQNMLIHGDYPPSTVVKKYENYLVASSDSLLKAYSDRIDHYREKGLLADHTRNIKENPLHYGYRADKAVFVKMDPGADMYREWQDAVGRLNSQLGTELQGDLHMLAVPAKEIDSPDEYTNALLAYWQSREYGKEALAKNAIILVVGVSDDGQKVEWARAKTGIPEGNGEMLAALSVRLNDVEFTPEKLIGGPKAIWSGEGEGSLSFMATDGAVEQIILRDYPFKRPCMMCEDEGESGGYVYLENSAMLPGWVLWVVGVVVFVLSLGLCAFMVATDLTKLTGSAVSAVGDGAASAWRKVRDAIPGVGRK